MLTKTKLLTLTTALLALSGCATPVCQLPTPPSDVMQKPGPDMLTEMELLLAPYTITLERPNNTGDNR